jgi:DNA polymerase-3 subunit delta|tara:strand:+ start:3405 stop:4400 length:996 start_codon:yes stop_codon:yes gene_type:complete
MIIKSFNLKDLKESKSNFFLFYGENEGQKDEVIYNIFLKNLKGEVVKYDESQILENKDVFFETCLNESLFESEKIIQVSRVTSKLFDIITELTSKKIYNKKIIFNSNILEKRSKIRQLFEAEKELVCAAFYQDNSSSLYKIANDFFNKNNISISSENINLIVGKCNGDRKNLQNEMNKILNFCFKKNKINRNQILKLINLHGDENSFELIDYCLAKNLTKVINIINNNSFNKNDSIILIRSLISRLKRLIELKKIYIQANDINEAINAYRPLIFWKDKEIVKKQMEAWPVEKLYELLDKVSFLEVSLKKNNEFSNNIIFDMILNNSTESNN